MEIYSGLPHFHTEIQTKMAATHECVLRTRTGLSRIQMDCNRQVVACPLSKTSIGVWQTADLSQKPLELSGHQKEVTCICLSEELPLFLCSASQDTINVWDLQKMLCCYGNSIEGRGPPTPPRCVGKNLGEVQHLSFNPANVLITVCIGKEVWVLNIQTCKLDTVLEGHTSVVTQAQFCPWAEFTIVTISEDRTFKVWNIKESSLIYQSAIISVSPFISLALDPLKKCIAIGSADSKIRIYDLCEDQGFRCLREMDVGRMLQKVADTKPQTNENSDEGPTVISSQPRWQSDGNPVLPPDPEGPGEVESEASILGLLFVSTNGYKRSQVKEEKPNLPFLNRPSHSSVSGVFESPTLLVAGTTAATLIINCNTWEIIYVLDFKEPVLSSNEIDNAQYNLPTAGSYAFVNSYSNRVLCLIGSLFNNAVHVINIHLPNMEELPNKKIGRMDANELLSSRLSQSISLNTSGVCDTGALRPEQEMLTVLSSAPLCANSPLKAELVLKPPAGKSVKKTAVKPATARGKSSAIQDQPLTFKSKVKSSGYIDVPRTKMFSPKTNAAKLPKEPTRKSSTDRQTSILAKEYPLESEPPTQLKEKFPLTCQPTAISEIVYSGSGKHVACALANKTAHVLRVSPAGKQIVLTGHDGPVTSAKFSHDDRWLLTSSTDRTVRLWSPAVSDPLLVINTVKHNFTSDVGTKSKEKDNLPFSKEVSQSSFYYVDKFILLSCGNGLYLYKYHIDPVKDEIKRYQSNNKYKLVTMTQLERAQNITCFSCVNSFHSYIVFCCGSNKSIEVIDMNAGRVVRVILDAHTRPVHSICQNQGSAFAAHPTEAYDLFLTAAVTDGIKLWDLRTNKCVRRYEGHVNRSHPVGLAFSPCARYIATGSEDRSAYLFDIRGTSFSHRLTGHTEVVSDVAFHPARPEVRSENVRVLWLSRGVKGGQKNRGGLI
ncbi:WD repeat-containing protein 27 isoform X2 [Nematostella vectensis]|uniref:WD repeat-containing protein 27 isoform X2 n=1 Tax=Nematostella vectensis TaxID=45351 RepID=UPI00207722BF|nr:WD repeat-containing protein 27 isoform X2 [Nematostella vectensis]